MRKVLTWLFFAGLAAHLPAQITRADYYNKIDNQVYLFSRQNTPSIDSVIAFVNRSFTGNDDKVRAYSTWIALNISYDMKRLADIDLLKNTSIRDVSDLSQNADTVFRKRLAVCEGFSKLMVRLCKASGIPAYMVVGYTKTPEGELVTDILHAWNAVKPDSAWRLLDITWSNGYVNSAGGYTKRFSDTYFMGNAKDFVKDHLPLDPMWQLLDKPLSKNNFFNTDTVPSKVFFNYNDSISAFFKTGSAQQHYMEFLHYHRYDPADASYTRNLDVVVNNVAADYLGLASIYYEDFVHFYEARLSKQMTATNLKKAKAMLEDSKKNFVLAIAYLKDRKAFTTEYAEVFRNMSAAATDNLKSVNESLGYLSSMQKSLTKTGITR